MRREIIKPIFIVGTGRCGSTLLHTMMSRHQNLAWLSVVLDRVPSQPWLNKLLMRLIDVPVLGRIVASKAKPDEAYFFWERYAKGFRRPIRDLTERDVTDFARRSVQAGLQTVLTPRRNRLLLKLTGWPRIGYLRNFPGCQVHTRGKGW